MVRAVPSAGLGFWGLSFSSSPPTACAALWGRSRGAEELRDWLSLAVPRGTALFDEPPSPSAAVFRPQPLPGSAAPVPEPGTGCGKGPQTAAESALGLHPERHEKKPCDCFQNAVIASKILWLLSESCDCFQNPVVAFTAILDTL